MRLKLSSAPLNSGLPQWGKTNWQKTKQNKTFETKKPKNKTHLYEQIDLWCDKRFIISVSNITNISIWELFLW